MWSAVLYSENALWQVIKGCLLQEKCPLTFVLINVSICTLLLVTLVLPLISSRWKSSRIKLLASYMLWRVRAARCALIFNARNQLWDTVDIFIWEFRLEEARIQLSSYCGPLKSCWKVSESDLLIISCSFFLIFSRLKRLLGGSCSGNNVRNEREWYG